MDTGQSLIERASEQHRRLVPVAELEYIATTSRMQDTVGIWTIFNALWRRKWLIFTIVVLSMVIAGIVLFRATPTFRAQSLLLIQSRAPNVASLINVAAGLSADPETIQSEMVILNSRSLAKEVVDRLELQNDPEFNPALTPPSWLARTLSGYERAMATWLDNTPGRNSLDAEGQTETDAISSHAFEKRRAASERADVIDAFLEDLEISLQGNSRVIAVAFSSPDPETAAQVPNTLADVYLQRQRDAKQKATEQDIELLNKRVASLRETVQAEDQAVEAYRRDSGLLQGDKGSTLSTQQLTEINAQLILAQGNSSQAETRLDQIQKLAKTPNGFESSSEVMSSPLIQYLREQEVQLQRKKGELSASYGPRHPTMVNLQGEIRDLKASIRTEANRIIDGYRNDVAVARASEESIQNNLDQLKTEVANANEKEIKLRSLEREADADRALLATFLSRLKETTQQQGMDVQQADARIVSLADVPNDPSFPKKGPMLALAFVGSSLLSVLVVLISEQSDRGFRSSKQVEDTMGMPVLGSVPKLGTFRRSLNISKTYKHLDQSNFALKEAMRSIYESILLAHREEAPRKLLITSSVAKEGKTSIAVSLARMEALTGNNVVVIDADLRSPDIHHAFNSPRLPGLVELVSGEAEMETVLRRDPLSGAWFITAGRMVSDPLGALTSGRLDDVLHALTVRFDLVIVDSPPSSMFVDARILSTKVDKTLFVVRWGETPQEVVLETFKRHTQSGAQSTGVVLSMTDGKIYPQYGQG